MPDNHTFLTEKSNSLIPPPTRYLPILNQGHEPANRSPHYNTILNQTSIVFHNEEKECEWLLAANAQ